LVFSCLSVNYNQVKNYRTEGVRLKLVELRLKRFRVTRYISIFLYHEVTFSAASNMDVDVNMSVHPCATWIRVCTYISRQVVPK
jgi:hypothetical protein